MSERAVYDQDELRPSGRRRRPAADWGVGEELFDHMPRRRFERRPGDHVPGRRTVRIAEEAEPPPLEERPRPAEEEFASREEALLAREQHDAVWGGDEPFADVPAPPEPEIEPEPPARRTVRIAGRPGELPAAQRRRPPRTFDERVGSRPDRLAGWAFALGILLILVALLV